MSAARLLLLSLLCAGAGFAGGFIAGDSWQGARGRAALAEKQAEYDAREAARATVAYEALLAVRGAEAAAAARAMELEAELLQTGAALEDARRNAKKKVNHVADSAADMCPGLPDDWLRLYNESTSALCALGAATAGPALACLPASPAPASGAAVSGLPYGGVAGGGGVAR